MKVIDFLEAVSFELTHGSQFMWDCYGSNAWFLESNESSAIIDTKSGIVYEVVVYEKETDNCFKWINADYMQAYTAESEERGYRPWHAYDEVDYQPVSESQVIDLIKHNKSLPERNVWYI